MLALLLTCTACGNDNEGDETTAEPAPTTPAVKMEDLDFSEIVASGYAVTEDVTDIVKINVSYTDQNGIDCTGDIYVRLFAEVAPITVQNFQKLVKNDFYTNKVFHRVYKNFMIQGGAPSSSAESTDPIKGEFTSNGFKNNLKHVRGVISMARTNDPDSASSQFFIMHAESYPSLDGNYASFGYVVCGMETVDGIANTDVRANPNMNYEMSRPVNTVTINDISFVKPISA